MDGHQNKYLLLGIENPLLDISVTLKDESLFEKYGLKTGNAVLASPEQMPIYQEIWHMEGRETIPGGSALNTVRAANFMLSADHPGKCGFFGCISNDEFGQTLEQELHSSGVTSFLSKTTEADTGSCAVLIHNNERSLVANLSACLKYPTSHLQAHLEHIH